MSQSIDDESAPLIALRERCVLDTPPELLFDQTASLAAYLCGTPIAPIGFIDDARHWFKSRVGWDYPEVPREDSICNYTIQQSGLLVISDVAKDVRFFDSRMVTHAGIRFYAGTPLLTKEGYALGTLCVMDRLPRELSASNQEALVTIARLITDHVELRHDAKSSNASDKPFLIGTMPVKMSDCGSADDALRDSQERLLGIISSAMDAIITVDENQRIIVFNRAAEQIFRCAAAEAIGQARANRCL